MCTYSDWLLIDIVLMSKGFPETTPVSALVEHKIFLGNILPDPLSLACFKLLIVLCKTVPGKYQLAIHLLYKFWKFLTILQMPGNWLDNYNLKLQMFALRLCSVKNSYFRHWLIPMHSIRAKYIWIFCD